LVDFYTFYTNGNRNKYFTYTYLMAWWRRNCITSNVTKVYFIQLKMNIERLYCLQEKITHFCFDCNSGISWLIFILSGPVETGMYTLQRSYQNLQHHCVSTLPNKKTANFETTVADRFLQCDRSNQLSATFTVSCLKLIFF